MRRQPHAEPYVGRTLTEMRRRTTELGKHAYGTQVLSVLCVAGFLLCAAGVGCAQGLRAGYAKVDVTPSGPVMMGGYDLRGAPSEGFTAPTACTPEP